MIDDDPMSSQPRSNFPMFNILNECSSANDFSFMSNFSDSSDLSFDFSSFQDPNCQTNNEPYDFIFNTHAGSPFVRLGDNASYSNGDGQTLGYSIASHNPFAVPLPIQQLPIPALGSIPQMPVGLLSTIQTPVIMPSTTQMPVVTPPTIQTPVLVPSTIQTPIITPLTTQTPIVMLSNTQVPAMTPSPTLDITQTPVDVPPTGHVPVTVQLPTQNPVTASSITQTPSVAPSATQIPVSALPKPRKRGPGRAATNISALSQSLSLNEAASLTSPTPSVPQSTVENQPRLSSNDILSTSSATSSLPLGPAGNQPTEKVRRSGCPVVPSKHSEVVPITSKTTPTSQNEKENVPPGTPLDWATMAATFIHEVGL